MFIQKVQKKVVTIIIQNIRNIKIKNRSRSKNVIKHAQFLYKSSPIIILFIMHIKKVSKNDRQLRVQEILCFFIEMTDLIGFVFSKKLLLFLLLCSTIVFWPYF